jgi:hypothetical protein
MSARINMFTTPQKSHKQNWRSSLCIYWRWSVFTMLGVFENIHSKTIKSGM